MIIEHFTHQFIGGAFLRTDVLRRRDNQLHLQTFAQLEQRGDGAGIETRRFIEEQQTARRDILAAQAAGFIFPALDDHHQNRHPGTDRFPGGQRAGLRAQPAVGAAVNFHFHLQIVAVVEQLFTDGLRRALPHVDLRIQALIELSQRFREGQAVAVEEILMLFMLLGEHIEQHRMGLTHIDVQTHAVDLAEGDALQSLIEHPDTILLALNGFANNVGHAAGADGQLLFAVC